jgi:hypothetical protein
MTTFDLFLAPTAVGGRAGPDDRCPSKVEGVWFLPTRTRTINICLWLSTKRNYDGWWDLVEIGFGIVRLAGKARENQWCRLKNNGKTKGS